jgi:hypothetical protein
MEESLDKVIKAIANDILSIARMILESNNLINEKVGRNTIAPDSELYKTLQVKATNDGDIVFDLMLNDYLVFIESGRRAGAKFPPVEPIVRWARKRGIPTDNSTIYLIRRAISRDGIKPRPFMAYIFEELDERWDDNWADSIFDKIMEQIDNFFK